MNPLCTTGRFIRITVKLHLQVSSFNLKILLNPPVVQGIPMRVLKLSKANRKGEKEHRLSTVAVSSVQ